MTVHIAITAHNDKKHLLELLVALGKQSFKNFKVVLVDDGSSDGTALSIKEQFPGTTVLNGDGNLWWSGATAWAIEYILPRASEGDFVLLLNNDLSVESTYIETLVALSDALKRAVVGSLLCDKNDPTFKEGAITLDPYLNCKAVREHEFLVKHEYDLNVDVLPGRGTLIPIEVFLQIGNIHAKLLPHYFADYEFTLRAKRTGYTLALSHRAAVYADLSKTGLSFSSPIRSIKECFQLLFSKRSKVNLIHSMRFAWLCSLPSMRWRNTFFQTPLSALRQTFGKLLLNYFNF